MLCLKKMMFKIIFIPSLIFSHIDTAEDVCVHAVLETKTIESEVVEEKESEPILISLDEFKLTAYCPCEKCCDEFALNRPNGIVYGASGEELKAGYSIAVDPSIIPYGTEVVIDGEVYRADDCGGAIKGNRIDVYFDTHQEALEFGVQYADVFMEVE